MRVPWLVAVGIAAGCGGGSGDTQPVDVGCRRQTVYLARGGGAYDHGAVDDATTNRSVLLAAPLTLAPWPADDIDWGRTTDCIRAALAPLPMDVTEVDPGMAPHLELVFTTSYWNGPGGTTMVIPASCRPDHQIEFLFGDALPTPARACHVAMLGFAEMTANLTVGSACEDFVNLAQDCVQDRMFLDRTVDCVDDLNQPAPCRCGGGTTENVLQALGSAFPACP